MTSTPITQTSSPGQAALTRDLARDLFPGRVTPFGWTVLRTPAEMAMRRTWAGLGVSEMPATPFWRLGDDGLVYLSAENLTAGGQALYGAAWLGPAKGEPPTGLMARLRAGNIIRRAEGEIQSAVTGAGALNARLHDWLGRVRELRWTQADLLQVMEELEPQAQSALQSYFTVRAGLEASGTRLAGMLSQAWPDSPAGQFGLLFAGLAGLPSVEAVYALADAGPAVGAAFLTRFGHRGPCDVRPDAQRWRDRADVLHYPASHPGLRRREEADALRVSAERELIGRLDAGQRRQIEPALSLTRELLRSADVAWEGVTLVMAAAQTWLAAAAAETAGRGLIADPADVLLLELEELKQVATGEWHGGYRETVETELGLRRAGSAAMTLTAMEDAPVAIVAGRAAGPALLLFDDEPASPQSGAILVASRADAGWTNHWLYGAGLVVAAPEAWSPGMIVARALGLPTTAGAAAVVAAVQAGDRVIVDGGTGRAGRA